MFFIGWQEKSGRIFSHIHQKQTLTRSTASCIMFHLISAYFLVFPFKLSYMPLTCFLMFIPFGISEQFLYCFLSLLFSVVPSLQVSAALRRFIDLFLLFTQLRKLTTITKQMGKHHSDNGHHLVGCSKTCIVHLSSGSRLPIACKPFCLRPILTIIIAIPINVKGSCRNMFEKLIFKSLWMGGAAFSTCFRRSAWLPETCPAAFHWPDANINKIRDHYWPDGPRPCPVKLVVALKKDQVPSRAYGQLVSVTPIEVRIALLRALKRDIISGDERKIKRWITFLLSAPFEYWIIESEDDIWKASRQQRENITKNYETMRLSPVQQMYEFIYFKNKFGTGADLDHMFEHTKH